MGNLALHSAEEPDNLRTTTGTVEVSTERDNDAAPVLGARPIQQHEPAARHSFTSHKQSYEKRRKLVCLVHSQTMRKLVNVFVASLVSHYCRQMINGSVVLSRPALTFWRPYANKNFAAPDHHKSQSVTIES